MHICVFVSTYIRSYECMCIYVYTCVCVCMRERESERAECVWLGGADGFYQEDLSAGRNRGTCV